MKKNIPVLNLENYQKQNNIAVDMCSACIIHERKFNKPIKAIILSDAYFSIFRKWVHDNYDEETACKEFYIDGVEIRHEKIWSGKTLLVEYFKKKEMN